MDTVQITAEVTPNPNTLKFNVNKTLLESGSLNYPDKQKAQESLLARRLFELESVLGVMVGTGFVTITKNPATNWQGMVPKIIESLKTLLSSEEALFPAEARTAAVASPSAGAACGDTDIEQRIKEILDNEIRPAVAMDGGDILFYGYKDGVVTLHLQGSCSSCPSSIMTLKMGVENRLRAVIPQVREVVQI